MTTPMTDSIGPPGADGRVPAIWMPYVPMIVASLHPRLFFGCPFACAPGRQAPTRVTTTATATTTVPRRIRIWPPFRAGPRHFIFRRPAHKGGNRLQKLACDCAVGFEHEPTAPWT